MKLALRHHPPRDLPTPGLVWGGTTTYGWNEAGLAVIADDATGNVLWIGIEGERWRGYATREGVGLGSTENQVQAALGPPVGIIADQHGKSIAYLRSGISFLMPGDGSPVGRVSQLRVYWPYRATGDLLVIPAERISSVNLGMSAEELLDVLGGGYIEQRSGRDAGGYLWPHKGLLTTVRNGKVEQVEAFWDPFSAMAGLLYATTDGVGLGSSSQRVRSVFGEPAGRRAEGLLTVWAYHALGLTFGIGNRESPRPETVLTIGILAKR